MKRSPLSGCLFLFTLLILCTPGTALAQGTGFFHIGVSGGADFPIQDQSDVYKTGYNGTLIFAFNFGNAPVSLRVDGSYHQMDTKSNLVAFTGSGNVRIADGTFDVVAGPRGTSVEPYFIGGVGVYDMRFHGEDITNNTFSDSSTRFGWNAGGGLAFPINASGGRFFIEARYTSVSVNSDRFTNSIHTSGTRFTFIPVNLGLLF
jgi:opacity protein-like surface antigen